MKSPDASVSTRFASPCAASKKAGSFNRSSDCSAVFDNRRRVQASVESGASKFTRNGYGVVR